MSDIQDFVLGDAAIEIERHLKLWDNIAPAEHKAMLNRLQKVLLDGIQSEDIREDVDGWIVEVHQ